MKQKLEILLLGSILLLVARPAHGQLVVDGTNYTNLGYVSNYDGFTAITSATGSSYNAGSGAVFDHFESDANTFRIDNPYNANGSGGSTDNFNGPLGIAGTQRITGSVAPDFSTLILKNGAASAFDIVNTAGANVFVGAEFENGITNTVRSNRADGALRFQAGATYSGGTSDNQHVNGYVAKVGSDAFTFPVGSGTDSRTLAISAPLLSTASVATAFESSNVEDRNALSLPLKSVSTKASWDWITTAANDDDGLVVTVSIPDVTGYANTSDLRLAGWDGTQWIDLSGAPSATGNTENSTLLGIIPAGLEITQIGIGSIEPPLPVTLVSFSAKAEGRTAVLNWSTSMETNSDRFEIEHSGDAKRWQPVGTVKSSGESATHKAYAFVHQTPESGANFYRLRMIDFDGTYALSTIRTVKVSTGDLVLYPNPATDQLTIQASGPGAVRKVQLISAGGQMIREWKTVSEKNKYTVDLRGLSPGIYLLQTERGNSNTTTHRIVKK